MSVDEIIELLPSLTAEERERVRSALDALAEKPPAANMDEAALQRLEEIWKLLDEGWCEGDGRNLSGNIDAALYGRDD